MMLRRAGLSRTPQRRTARLCALHAGIALAGAISGAQAQGLNCSELRPGTPSDYYAARGCGLLQSVEQVHLGPGQERLRIRAYSAAFGDFKFILAQFPNHPAALLLLFQTCEQWPSRERSPQCDAGEFLERAVAINPALPTAYIAQGVYFHRSAQYAQAIDSFKRALEIDPNLATAHYDIGLSYAETKQFDLANQHARRAYALGMTLPGLRNKLERAGKWVPESPDAAGETPPATSDSRATGAGKRGKSGN